MKITLNTAILNNNIYKSVSYRNNISSAKQDLQEDIRIVPSTTQALATYPNVNFGMNKQARVLLKQANWLPCAYGGKLTISPFEVNDLYKALEKRPNVLSALNLLVHYDKFLYDTESKVLDILKDAPNKGKYNCQDILKMLESEAKENLMLKQLEIMNSQNDLISKASPKVMAKLKNIIKIAEARIEEGLMLKKMRKNPLELLKEIPAGKDDSKIISDIYKGWYKLPSPANDTDAFIVHNANASHDVILRRIIAPSVGTTEHLVPNSRGGEDNLANYILVSEKFNNKRGNLPLDRFIELNSDCDIKGNLQKYLSLILKESQNRKSLFYYMSWYPEFIQKMIFEETNHTFMPEMEIISAKSKVKKKKGK